MVIASTMSSAHTITVLQPSAFLCFVAHHEHYLCHVPIPSTNLRSNSRLANNARRYPCQAQSAQIQA